MPKKRKTLPKDFQEIIKMGDLDRLKEVYLHCEIRAYSGTKKTTAIFLPGLSEEMLSWLLEQGLNINTRGDGGRTPLHMQAASSDGDVLLYLRMGADIDAVDDYRETPLHHAAAYYQAEHVRELLEHGANARRKDRIHRNNPLENMLSLCMNANIEKAVEIAEIFLEYDVSVTEKMKRYVTRIGESFEFYRKDFNQECLAETDAKLHRLYKLFEVEPVPLRQMNDGQSPIMVKATTWQLQHKELWKLLVPGKGKAETLQGEVIRISGKISNEILGNGGRNWDEEYRKMTKALLKYFSCGASLDEKFAKAIEILVQQIIKYKGEEESLQLCELAVYWVLENPNPILLSDILEGGSTDYRI